MQNRRPARLVVRGVRSRRAPTCTGPGRTVTEADNVLFTTLTMNTQALHLDAAWAAEQPGFRGERLVNSMFTLSTLVGLSVAQLTQGTIVGQPRLLRGRVPQAGFPRRHPLRRDRLTDKRESKSRPGEGHRHVRAHRTQSARRRRGDGRAHDAGAEATRRRRGSMSLRDAGPAWLFCPADRPERFAKAAAAADVVILDLEDGVAAPDEGRRAPGAAGHPARPRAHRGPDQRRRHRRPAPATSRRWPDADTRR